MRTVPAEVTVALDLSHLEDQVHQLRWQAIAAVDAAQGVVDALDAILAVIDPDDVTDPAKEYPTR